MNATPKKSLGSLHPAGSENWWVLERYSRYGHGALPVAAFPTKAMAEEWRRSAPHRMDDNILIRRITFNFPNKD